MEVLAFFSACPLVLSVPDISRERRRLQTSPEQLMATKDKRDKNLNFRPREAREFFGSLDKNSSTAKKKHRHSIPRDFALGRTKNSRTRIGQ